MKTRIDQLLWPEAALGVVKAGQTAVKLARDTNTKLVLWLNNQIVEMTADEWDEYRRNKQQPQAAVKTI